MRNPAMGMTAPTAPPTVMATVRVLILYNAFAGDLRALPKARQLKIRFRKEKPGWTVEDKQIPRTGSADWREINSNISGGCDLIVVIGGDGTLNDVVNGLDRASLSVPIAFLGTGTVNVFSKALKLPRSVTAFAEMLVAGSYKTAPVPVAEIRAVADDGRRSHRWLMFCEAGFLADSMVRVNRSSKSWFLAGRLLRRLRKKGVVITMSLVAALRNRGRNLWLDHPNEPYYSDILLVRVREYAGMSVPVEAPDLTKPHFTILGFRSESFSGHLAFMLGLALRLLGSKWVWRRVVAKGVLTLQGRVDRAVIGEVEPMDTSRFADAETLEIDLPFECHFPEGLIMHAVVPHQAS